MTRERPDLLSPGQDAYAGAPLLSIHDPKSFFWLRRTDHCAEDPALSASSSFQIRVPSFGTPRVAHASTGSASNIGPDNFPRPTPITSSREDALPRPSDLSPWVP